MAGSDELHILLYCWLAKSGNLFTDSIIYRWNPDAPAAITTYNIDKYGFLYWAAINENTRTAAQLYEQYRK